MLDGDIGDDMDIDYLIDWLIVWFGVGVICCFVFKVCYIFEWVEDWCLVMVGFKVLLLFVGLECFLWFLEYFEEICVFYVVFEGLLV